MRRAFWVVALAFAACSVYDDSLLVGGGAAGAGPVGGAAGSITGGSGGISGSGGSDASTGGAAGSGGCNLSRPPPRPGVADSSGADVLFALKDIVLDQSGDVWKTIGFDLDGLCSELPDPEVECSPPSGSKKETDGVGGTDNIFGHLIFPLVATFDPGVEDSARANQEEGNGALVLHVSGWNGQDDDPSVDVWLAQAKYAIPQGETAAAPALWDGNDAWYVEDNAFTSGDVNQPIIRNDNAYVAGRTIVFRLPPRSPIFFDTSSGTFTIKLTDATITAHVDADGKTIDSAVMGGRWSMTDLRENLDQLGVCQGSLERELAENLFSQNADVRSTPGTGGPGAICDAFSLGLKFSGYIGQFGGLVSTPDRPPQCGAGGAGGAGAGGSAGATSGGAAGTTGTPSAGSSGF